MTDSIRGKNVAIVGAAAQAVFAVVLLALSIWTRSSAAASASVMVAGGLLVWLMVALLFYARQRAKREELELADLAAQGQEASGIFADGKSLRPAAARLAWMDKWAMPIFTLAWAAFNLVLGVVMFRLGNARLAQAPIFNASAAIAFTALVTVSAFLLGRYAVGMSKVSAWIPLRAPASFLLVNVLVMVAVGLSLLFATAGNFGVDRAVAVVIPVFQLLLGVELVLSFIMDIYRPRVPGVEVRPSFDSRLCNLLAEPGKVGHSLAETLNYQFGFEVSKTWFYQLLSRAMVPLIIFAALVLVAMSSLVIVHEGERALVLNWGRPDGRGEIGPGLRVKAPWPMGKAIRIPADQVQEIILGADKGQEKPRDYTKRELNLWTVEHGRRKELDFLVAVPEEFRRSADGRKGSPAVNIIKLVVPVQYVVKSKAEDPAALEKFYFNSSDSRAMLENIAYREMIDYCARATLDAPIYGEDTSDRPQAIMTWGRKAAADELKQRIQAKADELSLGVKITFVGLTSAHPPAEASGAYEKVFEAERRVDEKRYQAEAQANQILGNVAGDPDMALHLALAVRGMQELERLQQLSAGGEQFDRRLAEAIKNANGEIDTLGQEIDREKVLGKNRQGIEARQSLLARHREHLAMLESLKASPASFDYKAAVAHYTSRAGDLFDQAAGRPSVLVSEALAYRWQREMAERGRYEAMQREQLAYDASPKVYLFDKMMDVWDEVLPGMMKYVITVDRRKLEVWLNLEENRSAMEGVTFQKPIE